jgi:putative phosphoribosyl transferase
VARRLLSLTGTMQTAAVVVKTADVGLEGDLAVPEGVRGVVLFAHGSGSSRLSARNRFVAAVLQREGLATLLLDLLTADEDARRPAGHLRFDVARLAERLLGATAWVRRQPGLAGLDLGYFGASTGAAAALIAAAHEPRGVAAIVSRGGRPDLAGAALGLVMAPTLLIAGGADRTVIAMNRMSLQRLAGPRQLTIIPGAGHLFEEPGALEQVAELAAAWFQAHLGQRGRPHLAGSGTWAG